jgi:hypothetical protein
MDNAARALDSLGSWRLGNAYTNPLGLRFCNTTKVANPSNQREIEDILSTPLPVCIARR